MNTADQRTAGGLLSDALGYAVRIMRAEFALAQVEVTQGFRSVVKGIAMMAGAVIMAITALNLLAGALVAAVAHAGLGPAWAAVVVGFGFALVAALLVWAGARALQATALVPSRALQGMQRNLDTLKEGLTS